MTFSLVVASRPAWIWNPQIRPLCDCRTHSSNGFGYCNMFSDKIRRVGTHRATHMAEGIRLSLGRLRVAQSRNRQSKARTSLDIRIGIEDDWMTAPRGVLAALEPSWDRENAESFFSSDLISTETSSGRHISQVYIQNWAAAFSNRRELKGWAIAPADLFSPSRRGTK